MWKAVIIAIIVLALILWGIFYSTQRNLYTISTPRTVKSTKTSSPPTEAPSMQTTRYFQYEEVEIPIKIVRYNFTSDKEFKRMFKITSAIVYYYLNLSGVAVLGEDPKLIVSSKVLSPKTESAIYSGVIHEVHLENIKLPYTLKSDDWVYIEKYGLYVINVRVHNAKVQGELITVIQKPIELSYGKEYFIKKNYGILMIKLENNENNLIFLSKKPAGGEIEVIQPISNYLISKFTPNWWEPTGTVAKLSSVVIPSYHVCWGGVSKVGGKVVKGGWLRKIFSSDSLFIIIESSEEKYTVVLSEISNLSSPQVAPILKPGDVLSLPVASHVEGVVFNVSVSDAPAVITFELDVKIYGEIPSEFWVGANLVNSSGMVVSTTPAEIIPGGSEKILVYLIAEENGMYTVWLSYNTGTTAEIGFTVKLLNIEQASLSMFEYDEEWGVWEGKIEYR